MITFHEGSSVTVETETHGAACFEVRTLREGEDIGDYLEYIMNRYWYIVGKNRRHYYEEYN